MREEMAAASAVSLSPPPPLASILVTAPKSLSLSASKPCCPALLSLPSSLVSPPLFQSKRPSLCRSTAVGISPKSSRLGRVYAASGDVLPSETTVEKAQQIVPAADDGDGSSIISVLLFIAFVGLSILTVGVIYIAVADFLQKREREKFEKEEAAKKKGGKKVKVRARTGPRGFGQKIEEEED